MYWVVLALGTHWPRLSLEVRSGVSLGDVYLDKLIHLSAFGVLSALAVGARLAGAARLAQANVTVGAVVAALCSVADEYSQHLFERTVSHADVVANLAGVACVWLVCFLWARQSDTPIDAAHDDRNDAAASHDRPGGFVSHAMTVSGLTLLSRGTGLVRDACIAAVFGLGGVTNAFFIAFLIPNLFRRLFGEGALAAAFIPEYTRLVKSDRDLARRLASACIAMLVVGLGAIVGMGEVVLWLLNRMTWPAETSLAIRLTMVMLPYMPLVCLVALIGGMLQVHGRFGSTAAGPIVLNLAMIGALAACGLTMTDGRPAHDAVFMLAGAIVLAGFVQLLWQLIAIQRSERLGFDFSGIGPAARRVATVMLPMLFGLAVFQINTALDTLIAFVLCAKEGGVETATWFGVTFDLPIKAGAVGALNFAQRMYQFPLGVFGIAVATAIFPALSRAADGDDGAFADTLRRGVRLTMFIGLPASAGLVVVALPLVRVILERAAFTATDAAFVAGILTGYAVAVWAYSMTHVLTRAFYAKQDPRTPLRISMAMVVLNLLLNVTLIWPLGAAGLAWSTAGCAILQVIVLLLAVRRYVTRPVDHGVWRSWLRTFVGTAVMVGALVAIAVNVDAGQMSRVTVMGVLALEVIVGAVVFGAFALIARMDEVGWVLRRRG